MSNRRRGVILAISVPVLVWNIVWIHAIVISVVYGASIGLAVLAILLDRKSVSIKNKEAKQGIEHDRYAAMSHLTTADERWLAEHFWVIPPEVARIRAGQNWDAPWRWEGPTPLEVVKREEMEQRAKFAKGVFYGENVTKQDFTAPMTGQVMDRPMDRPRGRPSTRHEFDEHGQEWIIIEEEE